MVTEKLMFKSKICFADRRVIPWLMAVFFLLGLTIPCNALSTTSAIPQVLSKKVTEPDTAIRARIVESYGRLPLSFEANHGQTDGKVKFLSRDSGYNLFLTSTEAVLSLRKAQPKDKADKEPEPTLHKADKPEPATVVSMKLVGANPDSKITGANQLPGKVNYFLGKDPKKWRTNIPTYARVRYTNVYPGIDLVFYETFILGLTWSFTARAKSLNMTLLLLRVPTLIQSPFALAKRVLKSIKMGIWRWIPRKESFACKSLLSTRT